jgi:RNA polymerase sigma factor (TIGR02999 family)
MNSSSDTTQDITHLLRQFSDGNREALDDLLPLVYDELRRQAANYLRRERHDHTLQTTALIHEAYIKLINPREVRWQNRAHFFAIAAQTMRRVLVDYARSKLCKKRGGDPIQITLDEGVMKSDQKSIDLLALDEALTRLAALDEQKARVVELKYFSGMTTEETAEVLGISSRTVERNWLMAKAWLNRELSR